MIETAKEVLENWYDFEDEASRKEIYENLMEADHFAGFLKILKDLERVAYMDVDSSTDNDDRLMFIGEARMIGRIVRDIHEVLSAPPRG